MFNINAQQLLLAKLVLHFQTALQKRIKCTFFLRVLAYFLVTSPSEKNICNVV